MQWDESYVREVERTVAARVQAAGYHLVSRIRENISVPSRTVKLREGKGGKVKKVLGPRGSSRSRPGEFPHKDFGRLRQSIAQQHFPDEARSIVGTNLPYGKFLELGTSKMAARPFLRRTLAEEKETIRQMITFGGASDIKVGS